MSDNNDCHAPGPTEHHARLTADVGKWNVACTYFMDPTQPPMECAATETIEAIGALWTVSLFESDFMGTPFVGRCTMGYDPRREKYVGTWIDAMSSHLFVMEGELDVDGKHLEMRGEGPHMATGEMVPMRMVTTYGDDGTHTFDMYVGNPGGDGEHHMSRYAYSRAE